MSFSILVSSVYMPMSGIAGSYDDIVPSFLRNFHNIFHSGLSIYIPTNSAEAFPFLHILSSIYWCRLFDDGHSDWCEAVLICVFLIMGNVEHLFMYLIVICMSSVEKCLFRFPPHILIGFFVFLLLSCMSCLHMLEINPLSVVSFAITFSHSEGCLFNLLIVSFAVQKILCLIRSHLFTFVFIFVTLGGGL